MIKVLELIGFALIGGTVYSYLGMIGNELRWPVFFSCAVGALAIIIYRKKIRQKENNRVWNIFKFRILDNVDQLLINRQIYKGEFMVIIRGIW